MTNKSSQQKEVELFLNQCGLSNYCQVFIEEGFERLESLMEITETDLIQMQVKRGHRRLLQRALSNAKGIPSDMPLNIGTTTINYNIIPEPVITPDETISCPSPPLFPTITDPILNKSSQTLLPPPSLIPQPQPPQEHTYQASAGTMSAQSGMSSTEEETVTGDNVNRLWKRKYHRHPKPDVNAPIRPSSAYVMFSNDTRAELKQQNRSFTDLAKIIGDRWKSIPVAEKDAYERNAMNARENYLKQKEEYQKTDAYKTYQKYLTDFKAENEAAARPVGRPRKKQNTNDDGKKSNNNGKKVSAQYPFYLLNADDNVNNNIPSPKK